VKISYTPPSLCATFGAWLACEWDMRHHWEGPYRLFRQHGIRLFGIEIEWVYVEMNE
jgi:hypothetical protein